jgi:hypothetical protein
LRCWLLRGHIKAATIVGPHRQPSLILLDKLGSGGPSHRKTRYERANILLLATGSLTQRHRRDKGEKHIC